MELVQVRLALWSKDWTAMANFGVWLLVLGGRGVRTGTHHSGGPAVGYDFLNRGVDHMPKAHRLHLPNCMDDNCFLAAEKFGHTAPLDDGEPSKESNKGNTNNIKNTNNTRNTNRVRF